MTADDVWLDAASSATASNCVFPRLQQTCSPTTCGRGMNGMVRMSAGASIANSTMSAMGSEACAARTSWPRQAGGSRACEPQAGGTSAVIAAGTHPTLQTPCRCGARRWLATFGLPTACWTMRKKWSKAALKSARAPAPGLSSRRRCDRA